jgi:hypothetical protein
MVYTLLGGGLGVGIASKKMCQILQKRGNSLPLLTVWVFGDYRPCGYFL